MDPYLGMVFIFGGNFAINGFAMCNGQLLPIAQNTALFSILGTTYGGNGTQTFGLPDLRGRVPIHMGQGPGLSPYNLGQMGGAEQATLTIAQMPSHTHASRAYSGAGSTGTPAGNTYLAAAPTTGSGPNATQLKTYSTTTPNTSLGAVAIADTGGNQPFQIIQPYLTFTFLIALYGIFPSRN